MHGSLFLWISLVDDKPVVKESQTKGTGACMGADDAADLAHQRLGKAEIIDQIGLDGSHLAGADGVTGQRVEAGVDAAQLFDLLEQGHIGTGQAAGLTGHGYLTVLDGDEGLDALGENFIEDPGLHRTLIGDGIATSLSAMIGGPANKIGRAHV